MKSSISKTDFILFLACQNWFWLKKNSLEILQSDESSQIPTSIQGDEWEDLVRTIYPDGRLIIGKFEDLQQVTEQAIADGVKVLFQATAWHDVFVAKADILAFNEETQKWDLYEVKASTDTKDQYEYDLTFQRILFKKAGFEMGDNFLVLLDPEYVRQGEIEVSKLAKIVPMNEQVEELRSEVIFKMAEAKNIIISPHVPKKEKSHLTCKPNDCPCSIVSYKDLPEYSIYNISRLNKKKKVDLLQQGITDVQAVPVDYPLSDKQSLQVQVAQSGEVLIDKEAIREQLDNLTYPLYFLDYETFNFAIPNYPGYKPYQQVPFQYSLHIVHEPAGELQHKEFLSFSKVDPAKELAEALSKDIAPDGGSIIVWNKGFECGRNKEMAERYPAYAGFLKDVNSRVYDLMEIFSKQLYVDPAFKGSASIKAVLPVLCPDLSYKELEVQNGGMAMAAWYQIMRGEKPDSETPRTRESLLKYCELDTLAMVEVWRALQRKLG